MPAVLGRTGGLVTAPPKADKAAQLVASRIKLNEALTRLVDALTGLMLGAMVGGLIYATLLLLQ